MRPFLDPTDVATRPAPSYPRSVNPGRISRLLRSQEARRLNNASKRPDKLLRRFSWESGE